MKTLCLAGIVLAGICRAMGQESIHFFAGLRGSNEVPPTSSTIVAGGDFTLTGSNFSYIIAGPAPFGLFPIDPSSGYYADSGGVYGPAAPGQSGPLIFQLGDAELGLGQDPCQPWGFASLTGSTNLTPEQISALKAGMLYVDFGSIRGQITVSNPPSLVFDLAPSCVAYANGPTEVGLAVYAWGTQPLTYTWVKNGKPFVGGACYIPATISDAGSYQVIVSNAYGSVTSAVSTVSVYLEYNSLTPPKNLTVATRANPTNGGAVTSGGQFSPWSALAVAATPNPNYRFLNWTMSRGNISKLVSTNPIYTSLVTNSEYLTANFAPMNETIATTSSPANGGRTGGGGSKPFGSLATVTAAPTDGYAFLDWTADGEVVSQSSSYTFTVSNNLALTAHFVASPYLPVEGVYSGLFYSPSNGVTATNSGYISLTITPLGGYSGRLWFGAASYYLHGQFALPADFANGDRWAWAETNIDLPGLRSLDALLSLNLDTNLSDAGAGQIIGAIACSGSSGNNPLWASPLLAKRAAPPMQMPAAGLYTMAMLPGGQTPQGNSYGSAQLSRTGAVAFTLNLADGLSPAIQQSRYLSADASFPIYASLYNGRGVILGWVTFTNDSVGFDQQVDLEAAALYWSKFPGRERFYPNGFDQTAPLWGCYYLPSSAATNRLGWTYGLFMWGDPVEGIYGVRFNPAGNIVSPDRNVTEPPSDANSPLTDITITPATGVFTGHLYPSNVAADYLFKGVVLNGTGFGYGFAMGPGNQTTAISFGSPDGIIIYPYGPIPVQPVTIKPESLAIRGIRSPRR